MYFLRFGAGGKAREGHAPELHVLGSSPEMLVRAAGRKLEYRPIAGTHPRGKDEAEDLALEKKMLSDEKERAEHVMLVDLGRNDLGRVSEYGSVKVRNLMYVERYSHVMHIVSALEGRLRPELDAMDAFAACFPAGTLSGAPKVRAMQIIEELEPVAPRRLRRLRSLCRLRRQPGFLHRHPDITDERERKLICKRAQESSPTPTPNANSKKRKINRAPC